MPSWPANTMMPQTLAVPPSRPDLDPRDPRRGRLAAPQWPRSEEHTSELQSLTKLVCRLLLEKQKQRRTTREIAARKAREHTQPGRSAGARPRHQGPPNPRDLHALAAEALQA